MQKTPNQNIEPITVAIGADGSLEIGGCNLVKLAEKYGTPLYVYDEETIRLMCRAYKDAFKDYPKINMQYACKATITEALCKILSEEGFGFDVVSGGELYIANKSGVNMSTVLFNGNNKSFDELYMAIKLGVAHISVDNFFELAMLNEIAKESNKKVAILLRITPGIECHTHEYIQTGHLDSKFGFDLSQLDEAIELILDEYKYLELKGLHAHIGSQIFETQVYGDEVKVILKETKRLKDKYGIELNEINLGGGLGIAYTNKDNPPSVYEIADVIISTVREQCKIYNLELPILYIEPGRSLVATSGVTLYTTGSTKQVINGRKYVAVDGGMADNPRPITYAAEYTAKIANKPYSENTEKVTIAGRFCESGDILIRDIELPAIDEGDILCVFGTGAYCYSMSGNYNRTLRAAIVLANKGQADIIVKREDYEHLTALETVPARLKK